MDKLNNSNLWSNNKRKNNGLPLHRCCGYHRRKLKNQSTKRIRMELVKKFAPIEKLMEEIMMFSPYMIYEEMIDYKDIKGKE